MRTLIAIAALTLSVAPASAEPAEAVPQAQTTWYGGQLIAVDGLAAAVGFVALLAALDANNTPRDEPGDFSTAHGLTALAGAIYALGPAALHLHHGQSRRALGSAGLRIALPLGIGLLASENGEVPGAIAGGIIVAMIVDDLILAWKPKRVDVGAVPTAGGMALQLTGSF